MSWSILKVIYINIYIYVYIYIYICIYLFLNVVGPSGRVGIFL